MNKIVSVILLALALAGCANDGTSGSAKVAEPPRHFDFNQAVAAIETAKGAAGGGDHAGAIASLQSGLVLWPAHQPGWAALSRAYQMTGDEVGANYAGYFAERIEWANSLHGNTAAAAFDNIALINEEKPFADPRIVQTAALLSAFYRQGQARIRGVQAAEYEARQTFGQRYLIYPVAIATGGIIVYQLLRATGSD